MNDKDFLGILDTRSKNIVFPQQIVRIRAKD